MNGHMRSCTIFTCGTHYTPNRDKSKEYTRKYKEWMESRPSSKLRSISLEVGTSKKDGVDVGGESSLSTMDHTGPSVSDITLAALKAASNVVVNSKRTYTPLHNTVSCQTGVAKLSVCVGVGSFHIEAVETNSPREQAPTTIQLESTVSVAADATDAAAADPSDLNKDPFTKSTGGYSDVHRRLMEQKLKMKRRKMRRQQRYPTGRVSEVSEDETYTEPMASVGRRLSVDVSQDSYQTAPRHQRSEAESPPVPSNPVRTSPPDVPPAARKMKQEAPQQASPPQEVDRLHTEQCPKCSRSFVMEVYEKHVGICKGVKQRKVFDSRARRLAGLRADNGKALVAVVAEKESREEDEKGIVRTNWREKSNQLRASLGASLAKDETQKAQYEEELMRYNRLMNKQCMVCARFLSERAFPAHLEKCMREADKMNLGHMDCSNRSLTAAERRAKDKADREAEEAKIARLNRKRTSLPSLTPTKHTLTKSLPPTNDRLNNVYASPIKPRK